MQVDPAAVRDFANADALADWLAAHGDTTTELWVRIGKAGNPAPSVDWTGCVVACITHGWIDGIKKPLDDFWYLQRITPRRPGSAWSQRNRDHADRLIASGQMHPAGMAHVAAARADGRWDAAYAGSANSKVPPDFIAALDRHPRAKATFATLNRQNLFVIYYRLVSAKRPETRAARMAKLVETLDRGETYY